MQSLHKRLDPIKEEVLKAYKVGGFLEVVERGYCRDSIAFDKWLKEVSGDGQTETARPFSFGSPQSLLDRALETFIKTVVDLKAANEQLRQENEYLRAQLKIWDRSHADQLLELVAVCGKEV